MMPLFSVYIAFVMPAALGVYWIAQSVFSLIQEAVLNKTLSAKMEAEEEARFQARQADRQRRMEEARVQEQQRKQEEQKKKTLRESSRLLKLPRLSKLPRPLPAPPRLAGWVTAPMPVAVPTRRTAMTKHNEEPL